MLRRVTLLLSGAAAFVARPLRVVRPKRTTPQMVLAPAAAQVVRVGIPTVVAAVAGVLICVEIKISRCVLNRRVDLHAIDATPARWRGDAGSSPLDGASAATCTRHTG